MSSARTSPRSNKGRHSSKANAFLEQQLAANPKLRSLYYNDDKRISPAKRHKASMDNRMRAISSTTRRLDLPTAVLAKTAAAASTEPLRLHCWRDPPDQQFFKSLLVKDPIKLLFFDRNAKEARLNMVGLAFHDNFHFSHSDPIPITFDQRPARADSVKPPHDSDCLLMAVLIALGGHPSEIPRHLPQIRDEIKSLIREKDWIATAGFTDDEQYAAELSATDRCASVPDLRAIASLFNCRLMVFLCHLDRWLSISPDLADCERGCPNAIGAVHLLVNTHVRAVFGWRQDFPFKTPAGPPHVVTTASTSTFKPPPPQRVPILPASSAFNTSFGANETNQFGGAGENSFLDDSIGPKDFAYGLHNSAAVPYVSSTPSATKRRRGFSPVRASTDNSLLFASTAQGVADGAAGAEEDGAAGAEEEEVEDGVEDTYFMRVPPWLDIVRSNYPSDDDFSEAVQDDMERFFGPKSLLDVDVSREIEKQFQQACEKMADRDTADHLSMIFRLSMLERSAMMLKMNQLTRQMARHVGQLNASVRTLRNKIDGVPFLPIKSPAPSLTSWDVQVPGQDKVNLAYVCSTYVEKLNITDSQKVTSFARFLMDQMVSRTTRGYYTWSDDGTDRRYMPIDHDTKRRFMHFQYNAWQVSATSVEHADYRASLRHLVHGSFYSYFYEQRRREIAERIANYKADDKDYTRNQFDLESQAFRKRTKQRTA